MVNCQIVRESNQEAKNYLDNGLFHYNLAHFPDDLKGRYEQIQLVLQDDNGAIRGGLYGEVCWNWLEIHSLLIDEELRKFGYGTKLLLEIEQIAVERKCDFIKVDTLSFQALAFYEKQGYQVFGTIDNVGRHFQHYYLTKDLTSY